MLVTPVVPVSVSKPAPLGELRRSGGVYRLYVRGERTSLASRDLVIGGAKGSEGPRLEVGATPRGVVYGTIRQDFSGAYTGTRQTGFVWKGGRLFSREAARTAAWRERVLFAPDPYRVASIASDEALLWEGGRFRRLGPAYEAGFGARGRIVGSTVVTEDGRAFSGLTFDRPGPFFLQRWTWEGGRRRLTRREPFSG